MRGNNREAVKDLTPASKLGFEPEPRSEHEAAGRVNGIDLSGEAHFAGGRIEGGGAGLNLQVPGSGDAAGICDSQGAAGHKVAHGIHEYLGTGYSSWRRQDTHRDHGRGGCGDAHLQAIAPTTGIECTNAEHIGREVILHDGFRST